MAETDNPYQNAHAESFWGRLKAELLEDGCFISLEDARNELFNYIEGHRGAGIITSVGCTHRLATVHRLTLKTNIIKLFLYQTLISKVSG